MWSSPAAISRRRWRRCPPLEEKDTYTVGFAQVGSNNPWRLAESKSMQDEAERLGYTLIETNANEDTAKQIADVDSLIAQGVDILIFPPRESQALAPSVIKAKDAGIPVILIDRDVDHSIAKPGEDYITFIGSDFVDQGRRAAEWLVEATGGEAKIIQLEGTTGATRRSTARRVRGLSGRNLHRGRRRRKGAHPGMEIIASQTGDFQRDIGREVMQTLLQAHPDVTAVYAHNDEMAIGAIAALQEAGRNAGRGRDPRLDRRRECRARRDPRWHAGRLGRVEPVLRADRLRDDAEVHRRRGHPRLGQGRGPLLRREQRRGVPGQAVLAQSPSSPGPLSRLEPGEGA